MAQQISVGSSLPSNVTLKYCPYDAELQNACGIPQNLELDRFKDKKVVIVGVPGAFTPTCNNTHLPEFHAHYEDLKKKGVEEVIFVTTSDPFVMDAWGKWTKTNDKIIMAADGNGEFLSAMGLIQDLTSVGFGAVRSKRFALVADHLKVTYLGVESGHGVSVSGVKAVLEAL
ncbi:hypothetical protein BGZ65_012635 [Modicella reniformis]|uniref:Thioredoxin-dependent peroxiredoxin n=1 Tax=Modicella reniformis TaxID=1440133 RepID=A0A9P6J3E3_9FUNG|nr:hypothetical protein BGZ65_012635 [Modicella reniformis]